MKSVPIFLVLFLTSFLLKSQYVDSNLLREFTTNEEVTYILNLGSLADVSASKFIRGKEEKASFVYKTLKDHADKSQLAIKAFLDKNKVIYTGYFITNSIKIKSSKKIFEQLMKFENIKSVVWDIPTKMSTTWEEKPTQTLRGPDPEWGILKINADKVWDMGYTGQGVIVAGQDTGYDWLVSPLQKKYRGYLSDSIGEHNYNWHDAIREPVPLTADSLNPCGYDVKEPCDDHNHGTHTMGTMVGSDSTDAIGVAPDAKWIACRNMDRGNGSPSTYTECFEWFLAPTDLNGENPDPSKSPHVINNSWACPESEGCNPSNWAFMEAVVENLRAAGIVVVVSAGNSGSDCGSVTSPAAIFAGSFTIGATRQSDSIAGFSSRGFVSIDSSYRIKPNVSAPGQNVRSVIRNGEFRNFSGTSMAGPHVAGAVALLISAVPELAGEVELIESILEQSALPLITEQVCDDLSSLNIPNNTYGYGRIDVLKAVELAKSMMQEFAPVGARWVYEGLEFGITKSIYKIECIGTKIVQGKNCKILVQTETTCDLLHDTIYVYQDINRVYVYRDEVAQFYLAYDFNKLGNESYRLDDFNWVFNQSPKKFIDINVDSVGTMSIDGVSFFGQYITGPNISSFIIPRIGDIKNLFLIEQGLCDGIYSTKLRCYSDSDYDIKVTTDPDCDIISNTTEDNVELISIQPNPTNNSFKIIGLQKSTHYKIVDNQGKQISSGTAAANQSIDVSYLQAGLYIISFDDMKRNLKFVKN